MPDLPQHVYPIDTKIALMTKLFDSNTFVTIFSNKFDMSARPLRDFVPYYAISAAYNSPIMNNRRWMRARAS